MLRRGDARLRDDETSLRRGKALFATPKRHGYDVIMPVIVTTAKARGFFTIS
jgi:hypothetical protein